MVYTEVERLNTILRTKNEEIASHESRGRNSEEENLRYRRKNDELEGTMNRELKNQSAVFEQRAAQLNDENEQFRRKVQELSEENRRIGEYENKMAILSKEIERLNELLVKYSREVVPSLEEQAGSLSFENEDLKRKLNELVEMNRGNQELLNQFKMATQEN